VDLGLKKINGVNFYNPHIFYNKCEYKYPNDNYDPTKPETETNTPYLNNLKCSFFGFPISVHNSQNPLEPINYGDTKCYCYNHKKIMIKYYKYQEKEKEKIEKKQAKELEKQKKNLEKKQAKELEKQKKILEKKQAKEASNTLKKISMSENVVLGPIIHSGCIQILKTGINKGKTCGCKIFSDNMCKRHLPKNQN
jgi:hypothetical protein